MAAEFNRLVEEGKIDPRLYTDARHNVYIHVADGVDTAQFADDLVKEGTIYELLETELVGSVIKAFMHEKYVSFLAQRDEVKKIVPTFAKD